MTNAICGERKPAMRHSLCVAPAQPLSGVLRVNAVWGLRGLLAEAGVGLAEVLDAAGLPRATFDCPDSLVPYIQLESLFDVCEQRLSCDHVGLLIGQRSRLIDMGLAGEAAMCERTTGEALRAFIEHFNLHDTAATCTLLADRHGIRFVYTVLQQGMHDTRHFQYGAIAITCNILRDLCGLEFEPVVVRFASRMPNHLRPFHRFFRAPLEFDCEESSITFLPRWLERPVPAVDEAHRVRVMARLRAEHDAMLTDFPSVVRRVFRKHMLSGSFRMEDVARTLSMHRRTLDRHLQQHGVLYSDLVDTVREDVARQLLQDTLMPIQRISDTVRYSSAANFATAFRRRTGMTPSDYRRSLNLPAGSRSRPGTRPSARTPGR